MAIKGKLAKIYTILIIKANYTIGEDIHQNNNTSIATQKQA